MGNFDKIAELESKVRVAESDLRKRISKFEDKLLASVKKYDLYVRSYNVTLSQIGEDDWIYGYLTFSKQGLMVAYRSTEMDLEDHLNGVPEEHQSHQAIKIEDAENSWIKVLFNEKNCQRLFTEIEKKLTADVDRTNQVAGEIPISSEIGISETNEDTIGALQKLESKKLMDKWLKARASIESDPADSITRTSSYLESLCIFILEDRDIDLPKTLDIPNLVKKVMQNTSMAPDKEARRDLENIMGVIRGLFQQIGTLRTHFGTAHGSGESDYQPTPEMARLANSLAAATSNFLIHRHLEMIN